jgi:hypothetical protein
MDYYLTNESDTYKPLYLYLEDQPIPLFKKEEEIEYEEDDDRGLVVIEIL